MHPNKPNKKTELHITDQQPQWTNQAFFPHPSAGDLYPHAPPEVPEGGRPWHHQGRDPRGGADGGR